MGLLSAPTSVFISLTCKCNLGCRHCAVYSEETPYEELDTEIWLKFFRELADLRVFRVRLSGGEPLMREDIWELIDAVHELPMRFSLNTNATRIDRTTAERLSRYNKIDEIMVSIDGAGPETHDAIRGKDAFRKMYEGVENLVRFSLPVSFYCTVNHYNFRDLDQIARLVCDWGVARIKFNDLLPEGRGLNNYKELSLNNKEWREALASLRDLRQVYGPMVSGTVLDMGDTYESIKIKAMESRKEKTPNFLSGCGVLIRECAVRSDGWITPCDRLPDLKAGRIQEGRFAEIWRSSDVFNNFRKRREVLLSDIEECIGCSYQSFCTGGCPATPYALYGKVVARNPLGCYRIYSGEEEFRVI